MKKYMHRFLSVAILAITLLTGTKQKATAQDVTVSYQVFYDNLSPYGQWVYDPEYGNVWVPNEDGDFRPYGSRGNWVMTEYGNTWVTDDPWGWAVYHYGRWTYNPYYGWVWIPGYEWAPAWVSWRYGGGYAGWAPLGPGVSVGVTYYAPDSWWIFVNPTYMYQPNCMRYWNGPSYNTTYIRQTTIINNYYVDNSTRVRYNYGPRAEVIQRQTGQPIHVYRVSQLNRPGAPSVGRHTVSLYRPAINRASFNDARPQRVVQAPRPVGRSQQAPELNRNRQPAFRQESQRLQPMGRQTEPGGGNRPGRGNDQPGRENRPQMGQPDRREGRPDMRQQENRPQPGRENRPQMGQPDRREGRPDMRQQENRPQPQREMRPEPQREMRPQPQPQREMRPQPQPQREMRPQPQPQREMRPQPQREMRPMPENRPQPQPQPGGGQPQQHGGGRHGGR